MSNNHSKNFFNGKGYYIALVLCAIAIGITGYVYYADNGAQDALSDPSVPVAATEDVQQVDRETKPDARQEDATEVTQETKPKSNKLATCSPLEGQTLTGYAMEVLSYNQTTRDWRVHNGVDIAAEAGAEVCAAAAGEVYTVYEDDQMGTTVVIRHENGYVTKYSSLDAEVQVAAGDTVAMGQVIGKVGNTALMETAVGDHLHFCVTHNDEPMDPADFIGME